MGGSTDIVKRVMATTARLVLAETHGGKAPKLRRASVAPSEMPLALDPGKAPEIGWG